MSYLAALGATVAIEVPLVVLLRRPLLGLPTLAWRRVVAVDLIANLLSHPLAFLVVWPMVGRRDAALVPIELAVVAGEMAVLSRGLRRSWWPCLVTSGIANATSVVLGALAFRAT